MKSNDRINSTIVKHILKILTVSLLLLLAGNLSAGDDVHVFEGSLGFQTPQAEYDKYTNPGLSGRLVWGRRPWELPFLQWYLELQYMMFKHNSWWEEMYYVNGYYGEDVRVVNVEESWSLTFGPRLTSPTIRGAVRPYIGLKGGIFWFYEKIKWDWGNDFGFWEWVFGIECEDDCEDDSFTKIIDGELHPGLIFELGSSIYPNRKMGIDFGIQYTVIPGIKRPMTWINEEDREIGYVSRKLNADYVSIYIGLSTTIPSFGR